MLEPAKHWPPHPGLTADQFRNTDWSATPLGPVASWPACLRVHVTTVFDSSAAAILLWGPELVQVYNDAYQPILGLRHPGAMGQPTRLCWPEVWHFNEPIYKRVLESGTFVHFEDQEYVIEPSGAPESRFFTITYSPARDETGTPVGVTVVVAETTERVLLERANRVMAGEAELAQQRHQFLLALADAIRWITDPDDIIARASEMLGLYMGVSRVLFCEIDDASKTFDIRRDWTRDGIASSVGKSRVLAEFGEELVDQLRSGQSLVVDDIVSDSRARGVLSAYAGLNVRAVLGIPLATQHGLSVVLSLHHAQPHHWTSEELLLTQEFVERTWSAAENAKAQAKLQAERDQSTYILNNMTEGFALLDRDWKLVHVNTEGLRLSQRTAHEAIGNVHQRVYPEMVGSAAESMYRRVMTSGVPESMEFLQPLRNGAACWLETRAIPILDGGVAVFFRDFSERKAMSDKLIAADRRKDEFLAMLAHELRNPLSPISSAAAVLQRVRQDDAQVKKASEIISRQVRHMSSLIDDLLDVSRVTRGLIELEKVALDAKRVIADAVEQVRPLIETRRHDLTVHTPPEGVFVHGDQKRLVQVMANILNNAAKYTPEGGAIVIRMAAQDANVLLSVSDTGLGMEPELLERAFELFAQETRTSDRSQGGLGLGLALVRSLVHLHGGTVEGKSAGAGAGSTFTVLLPRLAHALPGDVSESPRAGAAAARGLRLLVVDDNVDAADTLGALLEAFGHSVMIEYDGQAALARVEEAVLDACLLDIGLPDIDGHELAARIRQRLGARRTALIAVTGYGPSEGALAPASAFDHHFVKPVDAEKLVALLTEIGEKAGGQVGTPLH